MVPTVVSTLMIWFIVNKLSLNVFEKNVMLFSNIKRTASINAKIYDIDSEMVYVSQFLGVLIYIDPVYWKDHIRMIISELSKSTAIMHRAKYLLDTNARLILYYSPYLFYVSY